MPNDNDVFVRIVAPIVMGALVGGSFYVVSWALKAIYATRAFDEWTANAQAQIAAADSRCQIYKSEAEKHLEAKLSMARQLSDAQEQLRQLQEQADSDRQSLAQAIGRVRVASQALVESVGAVESLAGKVTGQ